MAFFLSVAGGALVRFQLETGRAAPLADQPEASDHSSASPALSSSEPTATMRPSTTPRVSPAVTAPNANATPVASATATPSEQASAIIDPPTAEEFVLELAAALSAPDARFLLERLHPAVLERYGQQACHDFAAAAFATPRSVSWEVLSSVGPERWPYVTDGVQTLIADAWTVSVRDAAAEPALREIHVAPADGSWRWFTDCGDPA